MSGLSATYHTEDEPIRAVRNVSFDLYPGETLALVGESGSGKTSIALALLGLLPPNAAVESGSVEYDGVPVPFEDEQALREIRGAEIAMIFQDPQAALTPMLRIGDQVAEVFSAHGVEKREAYERGIEVLGRFLPRPRDVAKLFSHQLSGGMAQRVMIAMATALQPRVIIADEPTASLDVAIRDTTLTFLEELRDNQDVAVLLITHDFGVVARLADRVAVVYAGEVVEATEVRTIFRAPKHPYTYGLLSSLPGLHAGTTGCSRCAASRRTSPPCPRSARSSSAAPRRSRSAGSSRRRGCRRWGRATSWRASTRWRPRCATTDRPAFHVNRAKPGFRGRGGDALPVSLAGVSAFARRCRGKPGAVAQRSSGALRARARGVRGHASASRRGPALRAWPGAVKSSRASAAGWAGPIASGGAGSTGGRSGVSRSPPERPGRHDSLARAPAAPTSGRGCARSPALRARPRSLVRPTRSRMRSRSRRDGAASSSIIARSVMKAW